MIAVLAGLDVEHELAERPFQPGEFAAQDHEARAGHARGGLEIHQAQRRAQIDMVLGVLDGEGLAPATHLDITLFVLAGRHVGGRQVRQGRHQGLQGLEPGALQIGQLGDRALQLFDLGHDGGGGRLVLLSLGHADQLGGLVAAALRGLQLGLAGAQLDVQLQDRRRLRRQPARGPAAVKGLRIVADGPDIVHGNARS